MAGGIDGNYRNKKEIKGHSGFTIKMTIGGTDGIENYISYSTDERFRLSQMDEDLRVYKINLIGLRDAFENRFGMGVLPKKYHLDITQMINSFDAEISRLNKLLEKR